MNTGYVLELRHRTMVMPRPSMYLWAKAIPDERIPPLFRSNMGGEGVYDSHLGLGDLNNLINLRNILVLRLC